MPRKRNKPINPVVPSLPQLEVTSRDYILNNRNVLRSTERVLRESPEVRRELDSGGGLNAFLTREGYDRSERNSLSRFASVQTSLFVDRVTQGDILQTPALQTMFESSRDNNRILVAISSAVDSCCTEIIRRLDDLNRLILQKFRSLRDYLISEFVNINKEFEENTKEILKEIILTKETLLDYLTRRLNDLVELVTQSDAFIREKLESVLNELKTLIRSSTSSLQNKIETKINEVIEKVTTFFDNLNRFLSDSIAALEFNIVSALTAQTLELTTLFETFYNLTNLPVISSIAAGVTSLVASTTFISTVVEKILLKIETLPETLESLLNKKLEEVKDYLEEWKKSLIQDVAQEVSLQVVGESYYRWDSISTYYPTLTLLFKEQDVSQYPKRSQIKIRLSKKTTELTEADIDGLRNKCKQLEALSYVYGTRRFNYVSKDKRFKTTVFGSDITQVKQLFATIFSLINESFDEQNFSITYNRNRANLTKRLESLDNIGLNQTNYQKSFKVCLHKVVLLVNGLEKPIILYKP